MKLRRHSVINHKTSRPGEFMGKESNQNSRKMISLPKYASSMSRVTVGREKARQEKNYEKNILENKNLTLSAYKVVNMVGKGGFGKVWKV